VSASSRPLRALALAAGLAAATGCASREQRPTAEQLAIRQRSAGETARRYDDPRTAASLYGRASRSAAAVDRPRLAADAACREGLALLAAGDPRKAEAAFARAAPLARDAGDPALAARALLGLARARSVEGDGADVAAPLREALALAREGKDPVAEALAELGLGALAPPAEARARYAAAEKLAGDAPAVAGPLRLNRARLDEKEGRAADARAGYRAAIGPLSTADDRVGLLAALRAAARHADGDGAASGEAADLHRRAALVADGLGRTEVAAAERRAAEVSAGKR
jgi:tetratricopeptide (TPR) repeat protein